jgi:MFS superfamily sulfate permease-like transporter
MAYAELAETDAVVGIYTAIFPVFIYLFFGPSRHISFGTNPLTSILVGSLVLKYTKNGEYTSVEVVSTVALVSGLFQLVFAIFKLGKFSWILSEVLISGYTTAAAIHVAFSQLKSIFGLDLEPHSGALKIPYVSLEAQYM